MTNEIESQRSIDIKSEKSDVVQSLTLSLTQVNHHYQNDTALIPDRLLIPMEQARPGTLKDYAAALLAEPEHRRRLDRHDNIRAYITLILNYFLAFFLVISVFVLSYLDKPLAALAPALLAATQLIVAVFGRKQTEKTEPIEESISKKPHQKVSRKKK